MDEVIDLANNFGVTPAFVAGNAADIDTDIAGLVDLLGVNSIGAFNRRTVGMTSDFEPLFPGLRRMVEFLDEFDNTIFKDRISSETNFAQGISVENSARSSYLVRAQPIPEPGILVLFLVGAGSFFGFRHCRSR